ncbi:MAG: LytR/AlgR family response regulator transcription factor [Planctomycetales bacterium]
MTMRVMIADDEPAARRRLRRFLKEESECEVVAECQDGASLLALVPECRPDLIFLDVRMPEMDGLSAFRSLSEDSRPEVVFVTAHAEYAVPAFDVQALDYLLKPLDQSRLQQTVARARNRLERRREPRTERAEELSVGGEAGSNAPAEYVARLLVRSQGRILVISAADVDWIEAAGKYVRLHVGRAEHLLREPLHHLASRLDPRRFQRIHRSTIVNLERIQEFQPAFHGDFQIVLRDGTELTLSRNFRASLEERLGQSL